MTGPATPGQEGPSYAPPPLPEGWIAQWDGMSKKYYFVQLSTGQSQWDTPTAPAPTGPTPQATPQGVEHPYGAPGAEQHPGPQADGDRSLGGNIGNFAMNQLMGGKKQSHGSSNSGVMGLASSFLGGGGKPSGSKPSGAQAGIGGILGGVAGSLLGGGGKKPANQQQAHQSGGGGGFMDSVGGMFGGGHHAQQQPQNNYGYSQTGTSQGGGYTGAAPPTSYQPPGSAQGQYNQSAQHSSTPSQPQYGQQAPPHSQPPYQSHDHSYGATPQHNQPAQGQPQYPAPYGQQPQHQNSYSSPHPQGGQYGGQPPQQYPPQQQNQQYGGPPQYGQPAQPQYGAPPSGNLAQPHHGAYDHSHSGGLYGGAPGGQQQQGGKW